ncbi:MAG: hypothetical protein HY079_13480 [Elusimicrobia bacterium]|nr:hypothetical protein [Elusimicrobiota bacterium]
MKSLIIAALCAASVPAAAAPQDCASITDAATAKWSCLTGGSRESKTGTVVVRTAAAWKDFWRETTGRDDAPAVDFKTEALAVSYGRDAAGEPAFEAVKVAAGTDDKTAVLAAAAYADSARNQAKVDERVGRVLATLGAGRKRGGASLAAVDGAMGAFDGIGGRDALRDSVASPVAAPRLVKTGLDCTPGVDCPDTAPRQQPRPRKPDCTPGVDCPEAPRHRPDCTPGVDCPGDGARPGNGGGRTPLPPNYRPRPGHEPSTFPPVGNPRSYDGVVTSGWYPYRNAYGWPLETSGEWSDFGTARARVERGGSEVGAQGTSYTANLESRAERPVYRVYWRYVGTDCDPNDEDRCLDWRVQYARFVERFDRRSSSMVVDVRFDDNGQQLLPWEKENVYVSFDGYRVGYDASEGAFRYSVRGPVIDQQTGRASVEFVAGARVKRQPEADKVVARLENSNGQLQVSILDRRAAFYEGEPLEVTFQVKKDCNGWFCSDKVVSERDVRNPVRAIVQNSGEVQAVIPVSNTGSGKYYIVWSFRRAQSKISSDGWVYQGKGPKVQY